MRSAFRREPTDWDLSDTATFDLSDELVEDETPKFNKLKVVVSGDMSDYSAGAPANGVAVNTLVVAADNDDDDSLLDSNLGSPGLNMDPCDSCIKKRESVKHRRVMKRLAVAAVLYFLFMIGELIGKQLEIESQAKYLYLHLHCFAMAVTAFVYIYMSALISFQTPINGR